MGYRLATATPFNRGMNGARISILWPGAEYFIMGFAVLKGHCIPVQLAGAL